MGMGYLMNICNQEGMRIQIGVDRNECLSLGQHPKIAQARPARFDNAEREAVLMPEFAAVVGRCRREVYVENIDQRAGFGAGRP